MSETNTLLGAPEQLTLQSGLQVNIRPLRTIELFKFLKIISGSGAVALNQFRLDRAMPSDEFGARMVALLIFAIPQAEEETMEFIRAMVEPVGLIKPERNKQDKEKNQSRWMEAGIALENPTGDDTLTIIEAVIKAEAGNIQSLGKRIMKMMTMMFPNLKVTPSEPKNTDESDPNSSEMSDMSDSTQTESLVDSQ